MAGRLGVSYVSQHTSRLEWDRADPKRDRRSRRLCVCRASQATAFVNDSKTQAFIAWAVSQNINCNKVRPAVFSGLRGLVATFDIDRDETVVVVPRPVALVLLPKQSCPCPEFLSKSYWNQCPWFVKLGVVLLHEKSLGSGSRCSKYLELLPTCADFLICFSEDEIHQLQYPHLIDQVKQQKTEWAKFYKDFCTNCLVKPCTEREFYWALSCVRSRTFSGPYIGSSLSDRIRVFGVVALLCVGNTVFGAVDPERTVGAAIAVLVFNILYELILSRSLKQYALSPVIDLFNHKTAVASEVSYDYFTDSFSVSATQAYNKGEQVYISYGAQSNDSLMQYYGFVEEDNPNDTYTFVDVSGHVKEFLTKQGSNNIAAVQQSATKLQQVMLTREGFSSGTLQVLRSILVDTSRPNANSLPEAAESQLALLLEYICNAELTALGSSLEEDESALRLGGGKMKVRQQLALAFRVEKKKLLRSCINKLREP